MMQTKGGRVVVVSAKQEGVAIIVVANVTSGTKVGDRPDPPGTVQA
jgi:hypothetical protein